MCSGSGCSTRQHVELRLSCGRTQHPCPVVSRPAIHATLLVHSIQPFNHQQQQQHHYHHCQHLPCVTRSFSIVHPALPLHNGSHNDLLTPPPLGSHPLHTAPRPPHLSHITPPESSYSSPPSPQPYITSPAVSCREHRAVTRLPRLPLFLPRTSRVHPSIHPTSPVQ